MPRRRELAHILRQELRFDVPDVLHFLVSVCQGLDHAKLEGRDVIEQVAEDLVSYMLAGEKIDTTRYPTW